jgi:hypothetical protein
VNWNDRFTFLCSYRQTIFSTIPTTKFSHLVCSFGCAAIVNAVAPRFATNIMRQTARVDCFGGSMPLLKRRTICLKIRRADPQPLRRRSRPKSNKIHLNTLSNWTMLCATLTLGYEEAPWFSVARGNGCCCLCRRTGRGARRTF